MYPASESPLPIDALQSWFELLRQMLPNPGPGFVAAVESRGFAGVLVSSGTDAAENAQLVEIATRAANTASAVVEGQIFAHPLRDDGAFVAVLVMELNVPEAQVPVVQHLLEWAERWLQLLLGNPPTGGGTSRKDTTLTLVEDVLTTSPLQAALVKLANSVATLFHCDRAAVGMRSGGKFKLRALSHGLQFDPKMQQSRDLVEAMHGVGADVQAWPGDSDALAALAEKGGERSLCGVPLGHVGMLILERAADQPFTEREQSTLTEAGRLLGPVLAQKLAHALLLPLTSGASGSATAATADGNKESLRDRLLGAGHWGLKAGIGIPVLVLLFLTVIPGTFRVHADASIEGLVQRAVVAPFDGYIAEANLRAGDTVEDGEIIASMEDRELELELRKSISEEEKLDNEYRKALAALDPSESRIVQARLAQTQAQTRLLREKLDRVQLRAPLAGVIISGDLSRSLGAPVERGDVLFEVAPLNEYRLVLHIEEADVAHVAEGQRGTLALTALPGEQFTFVVEQVSPVFRDEDGRVTYRTEARIEGDFPALRPGMEGVGKVEAGSRSYGWILLRDLIGWLQLKLWLWLP